MSSRSGGGRSHSSSSSGRSHSSSSSFSSGRSHLSRSSSYDSGRSHSRSSSVHHTDIHIGGHSHIHHHGYSSGPHIHASFRGGPVTSIIVILIVYAIFFILPLVTSFSSNTSALDEITTNYYYYQDMINYAKQNTNYMKKGIVKGIYQDYNYDNAWYIKYTVYSENNPNQIYVTDYTFSVYTDEQILNIKLGDEIMIAVDNPNPPILDSIDMNYGNVNLEDDPEYQYYKAKRSSITTTFTIYGLIATSIVVIVIYFIIKTAIKNSKNSDDSTETLSDTNTAPEKPKTRYCEYCGVALENGSNICKVCGARNDDK